MSHSHDPYSRSSKYTLFLNEPPSCILIAPLDPSLVVIGTYLYDSEKNTKTGSVQLFRKSRSNLSLELLGGHNTHAVLDIKFSPHNPDYLASTQTLGRVQTFFLDRNSNPPQLIQREDIFLFDPQTIPLSLAWSPTELDCMACTLSDTSVAILRPSLPSNILAYTYSPHSDQVWTCGYSPDGRILYSGGDDSVLNAQDLETCQMVWRDKKTHGAGVTAIMPQSGNNMLLTGSYDDILRIFDLRTRDVVGQIDLGGGVWRLSKRGSNNRSLIASCMYVGSRVVDLDEDFRSPNVIAKFEEHESMNYGCDIHPNEPDIVVSCSFYDKRVCIWDIKS